MFILLFLVQKTHNDGEKIFLCWYVAIYSTVVLLLGWEIKVHRSTGFSGCLFFRIDNIHLSTRGVLRSISQSVCPLFKKRDTQIITNNNLLQDEDDEFGKKKDSKSSRYKI